METDSFFCQLFKHLPGTLFELLGMPGETANAYRFDSVELKKAFRIDGLFLPEETGLPLYFVEVQFQLVPSFYANLFAKVFCFLEENNPAQEWNAVAIFSSRSVEPKQLGPYDDLLKSPRVKRIYLNEQTGLPTPSFGMDLLKLLFVEKGQERPLVGKLVHRAETEISDGTQLSTVIELVEGVLYRRYPQLSREEVLDMFHLTPLHKTRAWIQMNEESLERGKKIAQMEIVRNCIANGMSIKDTAKVTGLTATEVRRLAKPKAK